MKNEKIKKIYFVLSILAVFLCIIVNILAICHVYKNNGKTTDKKLNLCYNKNSYYFKDDGTIINTNLLPFSFCLGQNTPTVYREVFSYHSSQSYLYKEIPLREDLVYRSNNNYVHISGGIYWTWWNGSSGVSSNTTNPSFYLVLAPSNLTLSQVKSYKSSDNFITLTRSTDFITYNKFFPYSSAGSYSLYIYNTSIVSSSNNQLRFNFNQFYVECTNNNFVGNYYPITDYYTPPIDIGSLNNDSFNVGYSTGYSNGYAQGSATVENGEIADVIYACADTPLTILSGLLNFNILGFNIFGIFTALITICLLFFIVKKLKG